MAALLKLAGGARYKNAFYIGTLVFAASSLPAVVAAYTVERRPKEYIFVKAAIGLTQTVGLGLVLASYASRFSL